MRLVIDTSVVIKWFVRENLNAEAHDLLVGEDLLFAPDFLAIELANVAWKKVRRNEITVAQANAIVVSHHDGEPTLVPSTSLIARSTNIALAIDHPIYDCLYLACAEDIGGVVITADRRFYDATRETPYADSVRDLGDPQALATL